MKIALLLATGFEEIEALTPVDVLRRANLHVDIVGIGAKTIVGSHNIPVTADITDSEANADDYDAVIFPGGMPGATNLDAADFTDKVIASVLQKGGRLAAICAAPLVLGRRGLLKGKKATCYPGFEEELKGAEISALGVVTDGNVTTARGMGVALDFALELTSLFLSPFESMLISGEIMQSPHIDNTNSTLKFDFSQSSSNTSIYEDNMPLYENEKFLKAVEVAIKNGGVRTGLLQRKLSIGYGKAAYFIDLMDELGIIGARNGTKPREMLITMEDWHEKLKNLKSDDEQ